MKWNILSVLGFVFGCDLIIRSTDTLIEWRAWFLFLAGLVLVIPSLVRIVLQIRKLRKTGGDEFA